MDTNKSASGGDAEPHVGGRGRLIDDQGCREWLATKGGETTTIIDDRKYNNNNKHLEIGALQGNTACKGVMILVGLGSGTPRDIAGE